MHVITRSVPRGEPFFHNLKQRMSAVDADCRRQSSIYLSASKQSVSKNDADRFSGKPKISTSLSHTYKPSSGDPSRGRATKYGVKWCQGISCRICGVKFMFPLKMGHHCCFCGRSVCASCSSKRLPKADRRKLRSCDSEYLAVHFTTFLEICLSFFRIIPTHLMSIIIVSPLHRVL